MIDFDAHQRNTARKLGYGSDVDQMNAEHDDFHRVVCRWLDIPSLALLKAEGLGPREQRLARIEERAVLELQRLARHYRITPAMLGDRLKETR